MWVIIALMCVTCGLTEVGTYLDQYSCLEALDKFFDTSKYYAECIRKEY